MPQVAYLLAHVPLARHFVRRQHIRRISTLRHHILGVIRKRIWVFVCGYGTTLLQRLEMFIVTHFTSILGSICKWIGLENALLLKLLVHLLPKWFKLALGIHTLRRVG